MPSDGISNFLTGSSCPGMVPWGEGNTFQGDVRGPGSAKPHNKPLNHLLWWPDGCARHGAHFLEGDGGGEGGRWVLQSTSRKSLLWVTSVTFFFMYCFYWPLQTQPVREKTGTRWNQGTMGWLGLEGNLQRSTDTSNTLRGAPKINFAILWNDASQWQGCILTFLKATWHILCRDWGQWLEFSWVKGSVSSLLNHNQPHEDERDILVFFGTIKSFPCWKMEELCHNNKN